MSHRIRFVVGMLALSLLLITVPVRGQDAPPTPLVLIIHGDLFGFTAPDQPLKEYTDYGRNSSPVISPDGKSVAYRTVPKFVLDWEQLNSPRTGPLPQDIWVIDLARGSSNTVAGQPDNAGFASDSRAASYVMRPAPAWSPDSKALAWSEIRVPEKDNAAVEHLVYVSLAERTMKEIKDDVPAYIGLSEGTTVSWGQTGILTEWYAPTTQSADPGDYVTVFATDGTQLRRIHLPDKVCPCDNAFWARTNKKDSIILQNGLDQTFVISSDTRTPEALKDRLEMFSPQAPDGISAYSDIQDNKTMWHIIPALGKPPVDIGAADQVTIAPDGQRAAFLKEGKLYLFSNGRATEVKLNLQGKDQVTEIAWSAVNWRLVKP